MRATARTLVLHPNVSELNHAHLGLCALSDVRACGLSHRREVSAGHVGVSRTLSARQLTRRIRRL